MSKVKIETLTPVHIGSGNTLYKGMDYIFNGKQLYIIDHRKVLDIIGPERVNAWVSSIEGEENIDRFISRQGINVSSPAEYAKRTMKCSAKGPTMKECIHDSRGLAYIPGSSIKGAIRTAVLATELEGKEKNYEQFLTDKKQEVDNKRCKKDNVSKGIEDSIFSKPVPQERKGVSAPNTSYMRFLQVGDAYFNEDCEAAFNAINLNIRNSYDTLVDETKSLMIETINCENEAEFEIRLKKNVVENDKEGLVHELPACMNSLEELFKTINRHTRLLLKGELDYWNDISNEFDGAESYINQIKKLIARTKSVQEGKECILRVGYASGWRFTTGAWTEALDNFYDCIVPMSRPNDYQYPEYDFPKSRRVYKIENDEVNVLGFIKLTLI